MYLYDMYFKILLILKILIGLLINKAVYCI